MATCSTTASAVWYGWTNDTSTSTATCGDAWEFWVEGTASASTTAASPVWVRWVATGASNATTYAPIIRREPTAEERRKWEEETKKRQAEWEAGRAERDRIAAEKKKAEEEADKRAEDLLLAHLDSEQKQEYGKDRSFHVRAKDGRRYRIHRAWSGHVARIDDKGKAVERFCIHPRMQVPLPDNQLFAKLMLETDPETFRKTANVTPLAVA